jgi:hypothetical protein
LVIAEGIGIYYRGFLKRHSHRSSPPAPSSMTTGPPGPAYPAPAAPSLDPGERADRLTNGLTFLGEMVITLGVAAPVPYPHRRAPVASGPLSAPGPFHGQPTSIDLCQSSTCLPAPPAAPATARPVLGDQPPLGPRPSVPCPRPPLPDPKGKPGDWDSYPPYCLWPVRKFFQFLVPINPGEFPHPGLRNPYLHLAPSKLPLRANSFASPLAARGMR